MPAALAVTIGSLLIACVVSALCRPRLDTVRPIDGETSTPPSDGNPAPDQAPSDHEME
jgi:hypothetical protein